LDNKWDQVAIKGWQPIPVGLSGHFMGASVHQNGSLGDHRDKQRLLHGTNWASSGIAWTTGRKCDKWAGRQPVGPGGHFI